MDASTLEDAIARNHAALDSMLKGDCSGYVALLSDHDDVGQSIRAVCTSPRERRSHSGQRSRTHAGRRCDQFR